MKNITFDIKKDDENIIIHMLVNSMPVGKMVIYETFVDSFIEEELEENKDLCDEDEIYHLEEVELYVSNKLYAYNILGFEIYEGLRGDGLGRILIDYGMNYIDGLDKNAISYLNACPIGSNNVLYLEDLIALYGKKGFKPYLDQGRNILMYRMNNN